MSSQAKSGRVVPVPVVAIIGGGFTGAAVALHLAAKAEAHRIRIVVFEPRRRIGAGLAYDTDEPAHRINVPAGRMSLFPDDPEHFLRWIEDRSAVADDTGATGPDGLVYPRRRLFGDYVHSTLSPLIESGRVEHRRAAITAIEPSDGRRWTVADDGGNRLDADFVVVAATHPAPDMPRTLNALSGDPRLVADTTKPGALDAIGKDDRILVIGNGLTSADVIATLSGRGHTGHITAISRRGLRSRGHPAMVQEPFGDFVAQPPKTASELLLRTKHLLLEAAASGLSWHAVLDALRGQGQQIWQALPLAERRRIVRHLRPYWDVHRFRIAPQVEAVLDEAVAAGRLDVIAGSVASALPQDHEIRCVLRLRGRKEPRLIDVDAVVVTTGPAHGAVLDAQNWARALAKKGLLAMCPTGLGLSCDRRSRALRADGTPVEGLYVAGPLARGTFGELMGLPQVTEHAALVAEELACALGKLPEADRPGPPH
ncbi:FAD/NAD(P)-binding protein [Rhizobiaceae bacterium n13]|uniref:FAD/NAD(P)-binding protein n=1 Tax=Ferirhizobium litorale TaxID=2927786 RepID=A0AAE3QBB5_9HYPH|nr:FAD/NAD(P)-binding protein [Fererhizobium litorale]MDI7862071.1 FAD/NAD(P)-binding protein [Fererhizobium litorale]MDI7922657.1 FAD/NAD(P)-binding protein [Fererhizobium litorale]